MERQTMKLSEIISTFRSDMVDFVKPYLWKDKEITGWTNEAESEACRRSRLISDSRTDGICIQGISAGQEFIDLDSRVLFVRRFKLTSSPTPITPISYKDCDIAAPGWEDDTGQIANYIPDFENGKLRLYRIPTTADTVRMTVIRLPLSIMEDGENKPEINERWHLSLIHWIKYRAYLKKDPETNNEPEAMKHLALFEDEFGKRSTAKDEEWINAHHGFDGYEGGY